MKTILSVLALFCALGVSAANDYWNLFMALPADYRHLPESPIGEGLELSKDTLFKQTRNKLVHTYSWAVPNDEVIQSIVQVSKDCGLVDFGAGTGYWASLIAGEGVEVEAIDNWIDGKPEHLHYPVITGSYELLPKFRDRVLLLVWPPRATRMAVRAVEAHAGRVLVYVGEPAPARSTASPEFFDYVSQHFKLVSHVTIPQWFNRYDGVFIYERR